MKHSLLTAAIIAFTASTATFSDAVALSVGEDLNLDFSKEMESIEKINISAEPMQKNLTKGLTELQSLMSNVKKDPNALNKAKFEVQFAKHLQTLVSDMDDVLENRQEIQWALTDISDKVKSVTKRLDYNNKKMAEKVSRSKETTESIQKALIAKAREVKRLGKKADPALVREFKTLDRKYKSSLRTQNAHNKINKVLHNTLVALSNNGLTFTQSTEDMDDWFDNLKDQRDSFLKLAETRNDIQKLTQLTSAGGPASVIKTFKKLGGINKQMGQFFDTFDAMEGDLDSLTSFDAEYVDPNATETSTLNSQAALDRRLKELLED